MIKIFALFLTFSLWTSCLKEKCFAQKVISSQKETLVSIMDFDKVALFIGFDETKDEIIKQIGLMEFDSVKKYSAVNSWPEEFAPKMRQTKEEKEQFLKRINELKLFEIASYIHKYKGEEFGSFAIIRIPYKENENWNSEVKWEGCRYFILPEKYIQVIEGK